jgi:hypothetical protein
MQYLKISGYSYIDRNIENITFITKGVSVLSPLKSKYYYFKKTILKIFVWTLLPGRNSEIGCVIVILWFFEKCLYKFVCNRVSNYCCVMVKGYDPRSQIKQIGFGLGDRNRFWKFSYSITNFSGESVVATQHDKIVRLLVTSVGEIYMKTMPAAMFRLLTGQDQPLFL